MRMKEREQLACKECQTIFTPTHSNQKYCTWDCRTKKWRKYSKERSLINNKLKGRDLFAA
jgi:hypothetical protein